jgi:hypothetical protein
VLNLERFFEQAAMQNNPLRLLWDFLKKEEANTLAKNYDDLRFVGYVLDIGYDSVRIITSDPFKIAVGGLPRNSLLLMVPTNYQSLPPHFTLLRVLEAAPTPLSQETQQTYFELQKKSMPELDVFTQSELQWGALKTAVLGMYYPHPDKPNTVEFSGDMNNFVSAHNYRVYAPTEELLDLIVNSLVPDTNRFQIGELRLTESRLRLPHAIDLNHIPVKVSTQDFMGTRTALFGKTRLGKSNVVKLIAASLIEATAKTGNVGQLIFDINGEYANDNPQDNSSSLRSAYPNRCIVYALNPKPATPSRPLKLNFFEHPERSHSILRGLLTRDKRESIYVRNFASVDLPSVDDLPAMQLNERIRAERRVLIYWAILKKAGFDVDEAQLRQRLGFDPKYNQELRQNVYRNTQPVVQNPPQINTLNDLVSEFERIAQFIHGRADNDPLLLSANNNPLFERDERALLEFLRPVAGAGPAILQAYKKYHDKSAGDFTKEILDHLEHGLTVILDLGNADPEIMEYFSSDLSYAIFRAQVDKFSNNELGEDRFVQLYFEEAHNLFPKKEEDAKDVYKRLAKEGAKYHIGMVYSTQSVTSISSDLLNQTENFFIAHLSSQDEADALARENFAYETLKQDILQTKTVGYIRLLTRSHRFVIPTQVRKFSPVPQIQSPATPRAPLTAQPITA